jgi:hypothetical protein
MKVLCVLLGLFCFFPFSFQTYSNGNRELLFPREGKKITEAYVAGSTICILPSGMQVSGAGDCTGGEAFLIGQYVNMGISRANSLGTTALFNATYFKNRPLGMIADVDKNGFSSLPGPGFAGDYLVSGYPKEGTYFSLTFKDTT